MTSESEHFVRQLRQVGPASWQFQCACGYGVRATRPERVEAMMETHFEMERAQARGSADRLPTVGSGERDTVEATRTAGRPPADGVSTHASSVPARPATAEIRHWISNIDRLERERDEARMDANLCRELLAYHGIEIVSG